MLGLGSSTASTAEQAGAHHGAHPVPANGPAGISHDHTRASTAPKLTPPPFTSRMPVPKELTPLVSTPVGDLHRLDLQHADVEIAPGVRTPMLTYGGSFVGPTIRARRDRPVLIQYRNLLDRAANVHLHGGHVSARNDGHPMDLIEPGSRRTLHYPNRQPGATLWYHDHTHHREGEHVYHGLHGFYLIESEEERRLGLPDGEYDVPILIRDAHLDPAGALVWNPFGGWFDRTTLIANGKAQPYFPVAARKYRFRLLNAATHRHFSLSLEQDVPMRQIASDGGLLPHPVTRTELYITPGERVEVVVDFSQFPVGSKLVLRDEHAGPVLRFDVDRHAPDTSRVPDQLVPLPALPAATNVRDVVLSTDLVNELSLINGKLYDPDRVDFRIRHGATEIWRITNADVGGDSAVDHNFHIHLVQFRVLDRNGGPPLPGEEGLKDTVVVRPGETVRVQATFAGHRGLFVHHCHILEHSQFGMMAQFEVV